MKPFKKGGKGATLLILTSTSYLWKTMENNYLSRKEWRLDNLFSKNVKVDQSPSFDGLHFVQG